MNKKDTAVVTLDRPVQAAGRMLESLTLRRPKVGDHIAAEENASGELAREAALFSRLTGVNPEDIAGLDWEDYQKVQQGYLSLFRGGGAAGDAAA